MSTLFVVAANQPYAQVVMEKENGQPAATYTYGDDLLSQSRSGGNQYFVYDALGSTRGLNRVDNLKKEHKKKCTGNM